MDYKKICKKYEKDVVENLRKWIRIPSIYDETTVSKDKPFGEDVHNALDFIAKLAQEKGFNVDRHNFVDEAKRKGAKALVVNHPVICDLPQIIVKDTNKELANIVTKFYDYPSTKMKMIGITGTDGKTSTATIIYQLLNQITKIEKAGQDNVKEKYLHERQEKRLKKIVLN